MINAGTIIQIGFKNGHPCAADQATELIEGKIIFRYTDYNSLTYYIFSPTQDISRFSNHFYPLDGNFIAELKSVYKDSDEINNIIDYFGQNHRIICRTDFIIKKIIPKEDGCNCVKCKEFYPYAVPNQANNTLICYSCRDNPWR